MDEIKKQALELIQQSYKQGFKDGRRDGIEEGRDEVWEAVKKIYFSTNDGGLSGDEIRKIFGTEVLNDIPQKFSASEVINKLNKHFEDQKEDKIKVGDEVTFVGDNYTKGIVINAETTHPTIFLGNCTSSCHIGDLIPTGRHFPELGEYLKKLKED